MSIATAVAAEYGEKRRKEWVGKLEAAYNAQAPMGGKQNDH